MNPRLKKYKDLTTSVEQHRVENLLESTMYLDRGFKYLDLLDYLESKGLHYEILSGYCGETATGTDNEFKDIKLSFYSAADVEKLLNNSSNILALFLIEPQNKTTVKFLLN